MTCMGLIAIMSAMPEENAGLLRDLSVTESFEAGKRTYHRGLLYGQEVVLVCSRWGKVAAAATVAHLLAKYPIEELIFTGVAGAVAPSLKVGDVVIGSELLQHDLDPRPLFSRYEIPLLGSTHLKADLECTKALEHAVVEFLSHLRTSPEWARSRAEFALDEARVRSGLIVSGDRFFQSLEEISRLRNELPDALCVEMEGAAVAQVCTEHGIRFSVVRTISDAGDDNAHQDFSRFIQEVASAYSTGIVRKLLEGRR